MVTEGDLTLGGEPTIQCIDDVFFKILLCFSHYHLVPLCPSPLTIATLLSMSMSPFSFLLNPFTNDTLYNCTPETYIILLTNITLINAIKNTPFDMGI